MKRFRFGSEETKKTFKVFLWTVLSALIVLLIDVLGAWDVPAQYIGYVPIINTILYAIKEWIVDNRPTQLV